MPHKNEALKTNSNYLKGNLTKELQDMTTGSVSSESTQITKFHGIYQQDDRDIRRERRKKKLEPAYSFMIRIRLPGGVTTPTQWQKINTLASIYANNTIKLTTRQAYQLHGVIKSNLKKTIKEINIALMDTIAACGDVNRNVMCTANPQHSKIHAQAIIKAKQISDHLTPQTPAYHEIWLTDEEGNKENVAEIPENNTPIEPIYGKTYLPRKFKIVIAVPPNNDVDVFAHDLGFIAIIENGEIIGYNVTVGGGMGMTHGAKQTFPRLADIIGFCTPDQVVNVAEKVVLVQKEYGNRNDRKVARLKYTIENFGIKWFKNALQERLGYKLQDTKKFNFTKNSDEYGWHIDENDKNHLTLFIQNGRVKKHIKDCLLKIAKNHNGDFILTPNQNLTIAGIIDKEKIEKILKEYNMQNTWNGSQLRLNSMACVALPTCGLAITESERYLPSLVDEIEKEITKLGLEQEAITIRMTGCPNGCARPYISEIALVGRATDKYNLYLGGGFYGHRINKLYKESVKSAEILPTLIPILKDFADNKEKNERFGDFVIRKKYVAKTIHGRDFHKEFDN